MAMSVKDFTRGNPIVSQPAIEGCDGGSVVHRTLRHVSGERS